MRRDSWIPLGLALASFAACAAPWPLEVEITPLPPVDVDTANRVVDGITGEPLVGARLYRVPERAQPEGGRFWSDGCWYTDDDGFVRVPVERSRDWWMVDADGYAPVAELQFLANDRRCS